MSFGTTSLERHLSQHPMLARKIIQLERILAFRHDQEQQPIFLLCYDKQVLTRQTKLPTMCPQEKTKSGNLPQDAPGDNRLSFINER
jgi:hypothetical protein